MERSKETRKTHWELKKEYIRLSSSQRLYEMDIPIVALTGGLATGKSTVVQILQNKQAPIICADTLVKKIYQREDTKNFLKNNLPDVIRSDHTIDFPLLRENVFKNKDIKNKIENYIYQLLPSYFLKAVDELETPSVIIYDIPLLFEKDLQHKVDVSFLIYAPREVQFQRVLKRDKSKASVLEKMLDSQVSIEKKRSLSDFIFDNSKDHKLEDNQWKELKRTLNLFLNINTLN